MREERERKCGKGKGYGRRKERKKMNFWRVKEKNDKGEVRKGGKATKNERGKNRQKEKEKKKIKREKLIKLFSSKNSGYGFGYRPIRWPISATFSA